MKTKKTIQIGLVALSFCISACSLFQRHHSVIAPYDTVHHPDSYRFELGVHRLMSEVEASGVDRERAIHTLLDRQVTADGLCPRGYARRAVTHTENGDVAVIFRCAK